MASTYTVKKGDTLWGIAKSQLGSGSKYVQIKKWNNLSSDTIYPGQVLKMSASGSSGSSTGPSSSTKRPNPYINVFGPSAVDDNILVAAWTWDKSKYTEKWKVNWEYTNGTGIWFNGSNKDITVDELNEQASKKDTFTIPDGATRVRFRLRPVSKTYKDEAGKVTRSYFTSPWTEYKYWNKGETPDAPPQPNIEVNDCNVIATVSYPNDDTDGVTHVEFRFVDVKRGGFKDSGIIKLKSRVASFEYHAVMSCEYKVCARAYIRREVVENGKKSYYDVYSDWSDYSTPAYTKPAPPTRIIAIRADSSTQVYLEWSKVTVADNYEIEYTEDSRYFDRSSQTTSIKTDENTTTKHITQWFISGLESGKEYFFRVRAIQNGVESDWTDVKSVVVGTIPAAPTTWSSSSTAIESEDINLYWVHNSQDASKQTAAQLKLVGITDDDIIISLGNKAIDNEYISYTPKTIVDDEAEPTYECLLKTSGYPEGASIDWQVRTAGVKLDAFGAPAYGMWSTPRSIDVYAPPAIGLTVPETIESFPIYIGAVATPNSDMQSPTGYHISITATENYDTVDNLGNFKMVKAGDEVYSKYFNPDALGELQLEISPGSISLENGMTYAVTATVSMTSGLTAQETTEFTVSWISTACEPNAELAINKADLTANIRPYCEVITVTHYVVKCSNFKKGAQITNGTLLEAIGNTHYMVVSAITSTGEQVYLHLAEDAVMTFYTIVDGSYYYVQKGSTYIKTETTTENLYGESMYGGDANTTRQKTTTGELLYIGMNDASSFELYCSIETREEITDVYLSVYRRDFDGGFTEIATNLDAKNRTTVVDPHPALDYARYRIVATDKSTGHIEYYDCPAEYVGGIAAVIQWDETWVNFDNLDGHIPAQPDVSGSMLILPFNVDVSDSSKPESTLVEYIGRSHPVSYYGTQLGSTSTWKMVIPKGDSETLYGLRKLANWLGDVYVREPSGSGYWAQVAVSFGQKHRDLTIPVTLNITRVEGGA